MVEVEQTLAALEGAETALLLSSGMAATTTALMTLTQAGDEVLCSAAIYGGTLHLLQDVLARFGVQARFLSLEELTQVDRLATDRTRVLWFESPINPTLRCVDIRAVAAACRARGVTSVIDNTFASPINQQPLAFGVDLVMHSATKYLNGHSDVTAGVLAGPAALVEPHRPDAAPPRNDPRSPAGLCARPRPEDAAGAGRAAERQRPGDRRIPRPGTRA